jgi:PadR family transcriptional regulator, regulatory protein PadR
MKAETLKGHLDGLLLAVLEAQPLHGYAIIQALRARSADAINLPTGTLYPALHRLERTGWIRSEWTTVQGRRRRVYALTPVGRNALANERRNWSDFASAVTHVMMPQAT